MKILIYGLNYAPELTGIGKYSGEMSSWLAARGHDVRVVTAPPYDPSWSIREDYRGKFYHTEKRHPTEPRRASCLPHPRVCSQHTYGLQARDAPLFLHAGESSGGGGLVPHDPCGVVVQAEDEAALHAAAARLVADAGLRTTLGNSARDYAVQHLGKQHVLE